MNVRAHSDAGPVGPGSARLFIALWPDDPLRRTLGAWVTPGSGGAGAKPVARERLHLTLHFMASVPIDRLPALRAALRVPFPPFELRFSRCETWPGGLLVAPPDELPLALAGLHADLGHELRRLGVPVETRPYRPHITLARRFAGPPPGAALAPSCWKVRAYALVLSRAREGGGYEVLHFYPSAALQAKQNARSQGT
jgi:2'-5' RNA ligase